MVSGGTVTLEGAEGNVNVRGMATSVDDQRTGSPTLVTTAMVNTTNCGTATGFLPDTEDGSSFTALPEVSADVAKVSGSATAADNLEAASIAIATGAAITGTLAIGSCTTDLIEPTNDHYIGRTLIFTSAPLAGQATDITDYIGASKTLVYSDLTEAPVNGTTFVIV